MAKDQKKRQKALMKKRKKDKARKKKQAVLVARTPANIMHQARKYPIYECLINQTWNDDETHGLVRILVSRQQPNGIIVLGGYLVDMLCLGLKNTLGEVGLTAGEYSRYAQKYFRDDVGVECASDLAHQIIYQSIDYAAKFGFKPQRDFKYTQYILEKRGTLPENHNLTFGKDGKPFYISGPHDNPNMIKAKLDQYAGPGNYEFLVMLGEPVEDEYFDDE